MNKEALLKEIYNHVNNKTTPQHVPVFREKLVRQTGLPDDYVSGFLRELNSGGLVEAPLGNFEFVTITKEGIKIARHFN